MPTLAARVPNDSNEHAERGTAAHTVLERCLKNGFDADRFIGEPINVADEGEPIKIVKPNQEDAEAVQMAVDWFREECDADGDEIKIEARLIYSDDLWGTSDLVRYRPSTGELLVGDYKHGSGVSVDAVDNLQGICYGVAAKRMLEAKGLRVSVLRFVIIQPRCYHHLGPIREWVVECYDLPSWEQRVALAVERCTMAAGAYGEVQPDDWSALFLQPSRKACAWCNAAPICPAAKQSNLAVIDAQFSPVDPATSLPVVAAVPARPLYDPAQLAALYLDLDRVEAWTKRVREFVYAEAERGVKFPGLKLVPKRPTRRLRDGVADELVATLEMLGYARDSLFCAPELKSPAQIEAALEPHMPGKTQKARKDAAKQVIKRWVDSQSSGHNLAPDTDDRKAIRSDATEDFDAVA